MRRGVVLHLLAWLEVVLAGGLGGLVANAVLAAKRRQCRVRERHEAPCGEFLVHAHQIPFALRVECQDLIAMWLRFLGTLHWRWGRAAIGEHGLDRAARDV